MLDCISASGLAANSNIVQCCKPAYLFEHLPIRSHLKTTAFASPCYSAHPNLHSSCFVMLTSYNSHPCGLAGKGRIELLLALGATRMEATRETMQRCLVLALTPVLNQMSVMGVVSIPGMMTGQILGGTVPSQVPHKSASLSEMYKNNECQLPTAWCILAHMDGVLFMAQALAFGCQPKCAYCVDEQSAAPTF